MQQMYHYWTEKPPTQPSVQLPLIQTQQVIKEQPTLLLKKEKQRTKEKDTKSDELEGSCKTLPSKLPPSTPFLLVSAPSTNPPLSPQPAQQLPAPGPSTPQNRTPPPVSPATHAPHACRPGSPDLARECRDCKVALAPQIRARTGLRQ
ncbi:predicted protein [Histoplasma capsulatum H143]|uniref:Uncharacterized protein n=1 Tax=Ajellomyces capsulatus (strain H143) TaxID=544712 RepID=C6HN91_AJECH|nr:predicted protein [Histoplasma capsulatum H143]